jgi:hypothetical protein
VRASTLVLRRIQRVYFEFHSAIQKIDLLGGHGDYRDKRMTGDEIIGELDVERRVNFYFGEYPRFSADAYRNFLGRLPSDNYVSDFEMLYTKGRYSIIEGIGGSYRADMDHFIERNSASNLEFAVAFGDKQPHFEMPIFTKTRRSDSNFGIILKLNHLRHWGYKDALSADIPWEAKKSDVIWRGAPTGYDGGEKNPRLRLVSKYFDKLNVGFSKLISQALNYDPALIRGEVSIAEQLGHKYIISIEGNDVATNLKWILASNSVPIMTQPRIDSWLMESRLLPFEHYVPINDDYTNLFDMMDWCRANEVRCSSIARNGKVYMDQFSEAIDQEIERRIFLRFFSLLTASPLEVAVRAYDGMRKEAKSLVKEHFLRFKLEPNLRDQYGDPTHIKEAVRALLQSGFWPEAFSLVPACAKVGPNDWYKILFARALDSASLPHVALEYWREFLSTRPLHNEAKKRVECGR